MGCRVSYCIGGGCVPTDASAADWVQAFGYPYNPNDPLASVYTDIIASYQTQASIETDAWKALAEACMRTRAILFCNSNPGDVNSGAAASRSLSQLVAGYSSSLQADAGIGGDVISGISAIPVPGVGQIASGILQGVLSVFQNHAKAEAAQANSLSTLTPQITAAIQQADTAVANGSASPEEAVAFLQQVFASAKQSWTSLTKSCNAFCWYNEIMDLIAKVSPQFYSLLLSEGESLYNEQPDPTNLIGVGGVAGTYSPSIPVVQTGFALSSVSPVVWVVIAGLALLLLGGRRE